MSSTQQLLLGEGAGGGIPNFIEEVFSTQIYTGAGTSKTITNNIDLSTKGGLVWTKMRTSPASNQHDHRLSDSAIGVNQVLSSNNADPKTSSASFGITSFNVDGYTITNPGGNGGWNYTNDTFVSWTFRKQPKFFDIVTYTGDGVAGLTVAHNLGSVPGCIIVKSTTSSIDWAVYHTSLGPTKFLNLNATGAAGTSTYYWNNTAPTSTNFTVGDSGRTNGAGQTYVAYLFAHNAGGFGLTGTDNVISCGTYTTGTQAVTLGYEPQWIFMKNITNGSYGSPKYDNWDMVDNMRNMNFVADPFVLYANSAAPQEDAGGVATVNATGFTGLTANNDTWLYIAIRRGLMAAPTVGTNIFTTKLRTGTSTATTISGLGFPTDLVFSKTRTPGGNNPSGVSFDRLRSIKELLTIENTSAEYPKVPPMSAFTQDGYSFIAGANDPNLSGYTYCDWNFRRAAGFFDEVCYSGNGSAKIVTHNLAVAPELIIFKSRSATEDWVVFTDFGPVYFRRTFLNLTNTAPQFGYGGSLLDSAPTATTISLLSGTGTNSNSTSYVAYLFATCAGVSKVGSYTGNGTSQTIPCGFTSGSRFVLIKAASTTGDWMVSDSARGIVAGNDPYLELNNSNAEATGEDWLDTDSTGFVVNAVSGSNANTNNVTYIFLAIA